MSECRPCQEIICVNPDLLESYGLQGHVTTPTAPVLPIEPYGNQAVFYSPCSEAETLSTTADLPSWITLDSENNRLVGAANTYRAANPTSATATAQAALNAWGAANTECATCASASAEKDLDIAITVPFNGQPDSAIHCVSNDTLFVGYSNMAKVAIIDIVAQTVNTITVPGCIQVHDLVYSESLNKVYALMGRSFPSTMLLQEINPDGTMGSNYPCALSALYSTGVLAYDSTRERVLIVSMDGFASGDNLEVVDLATLTQVDQDTITENMRGAAYSLINDTFYVTVNNASGDLYKINASTLAVTTSTYGIKASANVNIYYADNDVLVTENAAGNSSVVNPATDTELFEIITGSITPSGACFNPCTNELQIALFGIGLDCYDADTNANTRTVAFATNSLYRAVWIESTNQTYTLERSTQIAYGTS